MSDTQNDDVFIDIENAVKAMKRGEILIAIDDEDRENEGDFVIAAQFATPQMINLMATKGKGMICQPITKKRSRELDLSLSPRNNTTEYSSAFTLSVDAIEGITTGISAYERAMTVKVIIDENTKPDNLQTPGHMFPLVAKDDGVLERKGHTEAIIDLCKYAELYPSGIICEIMDDDGTMARLPRLKEIAKELGIKIFTIASLVEYRKKNPLKENSNEIDRINGIDELENPIINLPTEFGNFEMRCYTNEQSDKFPHIALISSPIDNNKAVNVRIHSECFTSEVLKSRKCDCKSQLDHALKLLANESGVLIYLRQEGRGIGLLNKLRAYKLQEEGMDTVEANLALHFNVDHREYKVAINILKELGIRKVNIISNNPDKIQALKENGFIIEKRIPSMSQITPENRHYLKVKKEKCHHLIDLGEKE